MRNTSGSRSFVLVLGLLLTAYTLWLVAFWPGVLGEDSLAILLEVESPNTFTSGKPDFWYYFVKAFYQSSRRVELPIGVQLMFSAVVFARILAWQWSNGLRKIFWFSLVFICLAPHVVYFVGSLYPDGIFSVAVTGLLFELWRAAKSRKLGLTAIVMVALTLPVATFARPNGIVYLAPVVVTLFLVDRASRLWLAVITLAWCGLMFASSREAQKQGHGAVFPLALYETVSFLQPRPMNLWVEQPRVSPKTVEILVRYRPLDHILRYYDPDYWDPLVQNPDGPRLMSLSIPERKAVVSEFFRYNLWHNIPDFLGSRVNIFMVSALAQGGLPSMTYAQHVIKRTHSRSRYRRFAWSTVEETLFAVHQFSHLNRWLLWSPFLGIALLFWTLRRGVQTRDIPMLMIALPMILQLGAIFFFSIAGEYRYLFPFFVLPLLLLPIAATEKNRSKASARNEKATRSALA